MPKILPLCDAMTRSHDSSLSAEERLLVRGERVLPESLESLCGWYPVLAKGEELWWRFFGEKRFSEPFFLDTFARLGRSSGVLQSSFSVLDRIENPLTPTAFIFHVSRCGSTLLTQLLAAMPDCVVISEPPVIDSCLGLHQILPESEHALRKIVAALGQKRFPEEAHLFVKLDSWHIGCLPLFRRAFPNTPFVFLYRDPAEVMASHSRRRGRQMVPGLVDHALPDSNHCDLDDYSEKVLVHFFESAIIHADELILVNYSDLPDIVLNEFPDFFSIDAGEAEIKAMQSRCAMHAKSREIFSGDPSGGKTFSAAKARPLYEKLERLRLDQGCFGAG